jgi:hypothetical protein
VIINYLDTLWAIRCPEKANTVFFVDTNTVLPFSVSRQRLKPVSGRNLQILQSFSGIELIQLPDCDSPDASWAYPTSITRVFAVENVFRTSVRESSYHNNTVSRVSCYTSCSDLEVDCRFAPLDASLPEYGQRLVI